MNVEELKKVLFKDCRESRNEFFELRRFNNNEELHREKSDFNCCECRYLKCTHYDDIYYVSNESRQYYKDTCPMCVFEIGKCCRRFWNCCIIRMRNDNCFKNVKQAASFAKGCFHFHYERSYIELCMEGNIFENYIVMQSGIFRVLTLPKHLLLKDLNSYQCLTKLFPN